ncbi:MAG: insulinase family protein [Candidatus Eisenbacteria bacterium]|nr:insulinase family protein [Candidatus Eisenbacteria bacterium]
MALQEPRIARRVMPGGLTIVAEQVPASRSVALGVWIRCGSRHEASSSAGLTHFLEHMLFRGSRAHTSLALAKAMERIGGQVDACTGKESTAVYARIQPENLRRTLLLLAELVAYPSLEPNMVEVEKRVVLEEIRSYEDDPEEGVHDLMATLLWPDHPMGRPILGYERTVRSFQSEPIRRFHEMRYRGSNTIIVAAGDLNPEKFLDMTSEVFPLPPGGGRGREIQLTKIRRGSLHATHSLSQTHISLAARGPSYSDRRRYPIYLLNLILGAGSSSRLFQRIREREGLAYGIQSYVDSFEDTGAFGIYLSVDPRNLNRSFRLLMKELGKLRREGVNRWELSNAKEQMILVHLLSQESIADRMSRLALKELLYQGQPRDGKVVEKIRSITVDEVNQVAEQILNPARFCLVTRGPQDGNGIRIDDVDF